MSMVDSNSELPNPEEVKPQAPANTAEQPATETQITNAATDEIRAKIAASKRENTSNVSERMPSVNRPTDRMRLENAGEELPDRHAAISKDLGRTSEQDPMVAMSRAENAMKGVTPGESPAGTQMERIREKKAKQQLTEAAEKVVTPSVSPPEAPKPVPTTEAPKKLNWLQRLLGRGNKQEEKPTTA